MPHTYILERSGACITFSGTVTFTDFMSAVLALHASPEYREFKYIIHDMGTVQSLDFSDLDFTQLLAHELGARYTNPNVRVSIVTDNLQMTQLVAKFSAQTDLELGVFRTLDHARSWSSQRGQ
jgi:hypothetical protein